MEWDTCLKMAKKRAFVNAVIENKEKYRKKDILGRRLTGIAFRVKEFEGEFKIAEIEEKSILGDMWRKTISYVNGNLYLNCGLSISSDNTFNAQIKKFNDKVRFVKFI